ncbi:L-ribulose-5-phosphate 4-epimerase UlaF [Arcanobacterium haemolyticum]|uniref:L-ribulose-5-phosphate 4-epimerase n=1 Tax=Arcanobacterium haemolyticum TaxID=28264 RepID=UPI000D96ABE2|nr:L-ribulose-5-phosphate 4-epimerase [Arcanobacterium haemolyticum]SPT74332.1 L-ribulose-5-phosphate 4-epimerase UlaF [Arcanobacterium haemolyticum]
MKLADYPQSVQEAVAVTRERIAQLHLELPKNNLVVWTAGNISERIPGTDLFVIKPSGVRYGDLSPHNMVVCDGDGNKVDETERTYKPSSDAKTHAYIYRYMPDVGGVVHTHSPYATAFSAVRKPIPPILTMIGDEFGGEIPVGPFALIGDESIGRGIVETLKRSNASAVLMANHGPFVVGNTALEAVKTAVMLEEVAKTVAIAQSLGTACEIDAGDLASLNRRYREVYGQ